MSVQMMLPALAQAPFDALVAAAVAVAIHRYILLGQITRTVFTRPTWLFFAWLLGFQLLNSTIIVFAVWLMPGSTALVLLLTFGLCIGAIYLAMIFPAVAIGVDISGWRQRIETSFRQMEGNFWLLFWSGALAFLPVVVPYSLFAGMLNATDIVFLHSAGREDSIQLWLAALKGTMNIVLVMLGAAIASWLYAWIRQDMGTGNTASER